MSRKLLVVEDDAGLQSQLRWSLDDYDMIMAEDRESALSAVRRHEPPVVVQDLGLPPDPEGVDEGFATLQEILSFSAHTKVIVVTGNGDRDSAIRAVGLGAYDFYPKPVDIDTLHLLIERAYKMYDLEEQNRRLRQQAASPLDGIIGASDSMLKTCRLTEKVAPTSATILLLGETGTGKELFARALHKLSPRADAPFIAINCAAIPENLLESELFGYEKGAFTGAAKQTKGKVEHADGGTLFLDEIGDMPLSLQAKLLRFLQERVVERIGGREEISVDVRIICATHQDIKKLIAEQKFREDLYYRISEVVISIPPVRERRGDAIVLARSLLEHYSERHGRPLRGFTADAVQAIEAHNWPGNVREMENRINGAVIMAEGSQVAAEDLGLDAGDAAPISINLRQVRTEAERRAINKALLVSEGNISKAADMLGITRPTLYDLLNKHAIAMPQ
ncbi:MAG TPA: PEP-CTERM-box response regulator transcription factor [Gammaproteobacteria bacterium]|nr:PEP-CTERM-box response regulator transcription factor [Gammaproteobacteria bacterium]